MEKTERSLRFTVEKWLVMVSARAVRVTRGRCVGPTQTRYVCIEASGSTGTVAIYFFRRGDGTWCVFPPEVERPAMGIC